MAVKLHIVSDAYDGARVEPFEVPEGHTVTIRRHSQGADVFVTPSAKAADAGSSDELPPDVARRIRGMTVIQGVDHPDLVTLDILDGQLRRHRFLVRPSDLAFALPTSGEVEPVTPGLSGLDDEEECSLARARLTNAEAERVELEIAATRRALGGVTDGPFVAHKWSVERITGASGAPAFVVRLHGDGCVAQAEMSLSLAASLSGRLALGVADDLAEPRRER